MLTHREDGDGIEATGSIITCQDDNVIGKKSELSVSAEKNVLASITDRLPCGRRDYLLEGQIKVSKLLFEKGKINFDKEVEIYNDSKIYKKG